MLLFRKFVLGTTIAYLPKGPVGMEWQDLLKDITRVCKQERAILIYIEPDEWEGEGNHSVLEEAGFDESEISIQPRQTIVISLDGEPEGWLSRMKQKTRYNIRLAERKDVVITQSADIATFTALMKVTGERDAFGIHDAAYYENVYKLFAPSGACTMFLACYHEVALAGIMVFLRGNRAWYFYGASNNQERNRMPTYLLQWAAMKWAAENGAEIYDLWGIPDGAESELEAQFTSRSDGLWGVYRFKRGFGGEIRRSAAVYQKVLNKPFNAIYQLLLKYRKTLVS